MTIHLLETVWGQTPGEIIVFIQCTHYEVNKNLVVIRDGEQYKIFGYQNFLDWYCHMNEEIKYTQVAKDVFEDEVKFQNFLIDTFFEKCHVAVKVTFRDCIEKLDKKLFPTKASENEKTEMQNWIEETYNDAKFIPVSANCAIITTSQPNMENICAILEEENVIEEKCYIL